MFGLAACETVHALQKSAFPSAGAPSHVALLPPSARVGVALVEHATAAKMHVADSKETR